MCCCTPLCAVMGGWWRSIRARGLCTSARSVLPTAPNSPTDSASWGSRSTPGTGRGGRYFEFDGDPAAAARSVVKPPSPGPGRDRRPAGRSAARAARAIIRGAEARDASDAAEPARSAAQTGQLSPKQERLDGDRHPLAQKLPSPHTTSTRTGGRPPVRHGRRAGSGSTSCAARPQDGARPQPRPDEVLEALTEFDATFPAWDARAVALEHSAGVTDRPGARPAARPARHAAEMLRLADGTGTTQQHRAREHATVHHRPAVTADPATPIPDRDSSQEEIDPA